MAADGVEGECRRALALYHAGQYDAALNLCLSLSDASQLPPSIFRLVAHMFLEGKGTAEDRNEALRWCRRAAEAGDSDTQSFLGGQARLAGRYAEAAAWFEQASSQGHPRAAIQLGYLYDHGLGVARDPRSARHYYELAARQGYPYAKRMIAGQMLRGDDGWLGRARGIPLLITSVIEFVRIRLTDGDSPKGYPEKTKGRV